MIFRREESLILDFYKDKSLQVANITTQHVMDSMIEKDPLEVSRKINKLSQLGDIKIGVIGNRGLPVFNTDIPAPKEIFAAKKETHLTTKDDLIFYKPIKNEFRCHACHNPKDEARGMIVIKTSLKKAQTEVRETAKRLIIFAILIGLVSEIFLIIVLRKMIIKPLEILNKSADILKSGNLSHRIEMNKDDEIGTLVSCFNEMAESIEKAHLNLESAVRQKTKELRVIAELSFKVFKGDLSLEEIIGQFLNSIIDLMGYDYSALCLIDKETGLLLQEFKKGLNVDICSVEISVASDHPFIKTIREGRPSVRHSANLGLPPEFGNVVTIPILSHQRKRCREINLCTYSDCPAFNSDDERCWLMPDTLCRSPQSVAGKEKIYGCLHCDVFPIIGVLIAGKNDDITKTSLHSLEILASEIASAIENQRLIAGKRHDINSLVKLHDISVQTIRDLDISALTRAIVSSAVIFGNMDSAILWLKDTNGKLHLKGASENIKNDLIPDSISVSESLVGEALSKEQLFETVKISSSDSLHDFIRKNDFLYMAAVPLQLKGTTYGCLSLFKKKDFLMTDAEKAIVRLFAGQASAAIHTAQIFGELKTEKEFTDAVLSNMTMGVMVFDIDGRIIRANNAAFEILRVNDYIAGKRLQEALPEASDFLNIAPYIGKEIEIRDGQNTVPIGFTSSYLLDEKGERTGTIVVFRDLTEIRKLQAEVRKKQHFEAMGKVIAGVAHEIRNPLFGISSIVQILDREIKSEKHHPLLQAMLKEIYRLKNLVEELLLYSRPSKLNIAEINMNVLVEKIVHHAKAKKDGISIELSTEPLTVLKADIDKLTQILLNLADNAIGAGSDTIKITLEKKNASAILTVKDNGIGIKKENFDRIFDPFFTTKKEGTGLGLSISRKLIEDHGGSIEIMSSEGEGTEVILTLPA